MFVSHVWNKGGNCQYIGICHYVYDAKSSQKSEKLIVYFKFLKGILSKFGDSLLYL